MMGEYMCTMVLLFGPSVLMWILSASFVFSVVFCLPITAMSVAAFASVLMVTRVLATRVMRSESETQVVTTLKGMLWWAVRDEESDAPFGLPLNPFCLTLIAAFIPLLIGSLIVYGAAHLRLASGARGRGTRAPRRAEYARQSVRASRPL